MTLTDSLGVEIVVNDEARTETPEGFRAIAVQGRDVIGVFTEALGVDSVRAYRIESAARP